MASSSIIIKAALKNLGSPKLHSKAVRNGCLSFVLAIAMTGCGSLRNSTKYELDDDYYHYKQEGGEYQRVFTYVQDDTIRIFKDKNSSEQIAFTPERDQFFVKRSLMSM